MAFVRIELIRGTQLRDHALEAIDEPVVRDRLTTMISDHIRRRLPDAIPPHIRDQDVREAVDEAIDLPAFRAAFGTAVQRARDRMVDGRSADIEIPLAAIAQVIVPRIEQIDAGLAEQAGALLREDSVVVTTQQDLDQVTRLIRIARTLAVVLPVVAALCFALALVVARRRVDRVIGIGIAVTVAGVALIAASAVGRRVVESLAAPGESEVAGAVWSVFAGGMRSWGIVTTIAGGAVLLAGLIATTARNGRPPAPRPA